MATIYRGTKLKIIPENERIMAGINADNNKIGNFKNGFMVEICFHFKSSHNITQKIIKNPKMIAIS